MDNIKNILKDSDVKVEDLGSCLKEKGVLLEASFGGGRNSYKISPESFGVDKDNLSDDSKDFFQNHLRDGTVVFVPRDKYKQLRSIESKTKKKLREITIGYNGQFVPIKDFEEFVEYFENSKNEYFAIRDELVADYPNIVSRFKKILSQSLIDMDVDIKVAEKQYLEIVSKLPSQTAFKNSFRADLSISLMPTVDEFDGYGFGDDIKEAISSQYQAIGNNLIGDSTVVVLQEAVDSLVGLINSFNRSGNVHHKTREGLKNCVVKMERKNIFENKKLDEVKDRVKCLINTESDMAVQQSEILLAEIYVYSKKIDIDSKIDLSKSSILPMELERLHEVLN